MNSVSSQGGENAELSREGSPVAIEYRRGRTREGAQWPVLTLL